MIVYVYSDKDKDFVEQNKTLDIWPEEVRYVPFEQIDALDPSEISHLLVTGWVKEIKVIIQMAYLNGITLGIVPTPKQKELIRTLDLPEKTEEAVMLALKPADKRLDILLCNGTVVLQEVVIGDAPPLDHFDTVLKGKTLFDRIKLFWLTLRKVKTLHHTRIKVENAKQNALTLSAVGMVAMEYNNATFAAKLFSDKLSANDGRLLLVILAPSSILQYVGYLFQSLISYITPKTLPGSVGYISSSEITLTPERPMGVKIDATEVTQTPVHFRVEEEILALSVGEKFWEKQNAVQSTKDSVKVDHLPSDEENADFLGKNIPLFTHASQAQYASLFSSLREEGKLSSVFIVLLVLSTLIATFGLFINSSSVVIGAMLLAPLMQPIVSLSMGVLRQDTSLEINGAKSIFWGVVAVLATAALIATFTPIEKMTSEMAGRLSPTILDLFVAIVSGIAAAYVKSNEKILGALAGVAIAVALVPPLAVAGIGLGWMNWHMFLMAFLLFITNLVGIVLAAALTFVVLGFSPWKVAKKGIYTWLLIASLIAIPLYNAFIQMKEDINMQKILSNISFKLEAHEVTLTHIQLLHRPKKDVVRCEVISSGILSKTEKKTLKEAILKSIGKEVDVIVTFRYKL